MSLYFLLVKWGHPTAGRAPQATGPEQTDQPSTSKVLECWGVGKAHVLLSHGR